MTNIYMKLNIVRNVEKAQNWMQRWIYSSKQKKGIEFIWIYPYELVIKSLFLLNQKPYKQKIVRHNNQLFL